MADGVVVVRMPAPARVLVNPTVLGMTAAQVDEAIAAALSGTAKVVALSQAEYVALDAPDPTTLYVLTT